MSKSVETSWKRATMTLHANQVQSVPELCLSVRRDRNDNIMKLQVTCPTGNWCRACVAGRRRSDAHLTHRTSSSTTTTIGIDYGYLENRVTLGEQEAGPSPILVTRSSTTQVATADVLPCNCTAHPWCVQALVRAIVSTGDAKVILQSDNEPAILDLKRQAAAECCVKTLKRP